MRMLKYFTAVIVAVTAAVAVPTAAHAAPSWNSGTVAPGASQSWVWNNVPAGIAYEVGLTPMWATPSATCSFEIMRTSYVQQPGGEREFRFTIKNIGTISCATQITLRELVSVAGLWQLPTLSPGASTTRTWNNASLTSSYAPGLVP